MVSAARIIGFAASLLATWGTSSLAAACPDCATTQLVQAAVFDGNFWLHLTLMSLPIFVLGFVALMLFRIDLAADDPVPGSMVPLAEPTLEVEP